MSKDNKKCVVEVWSRTVGFFRPIQDWSNGKVEEFHERKHFDKSIEDKDAKEEKRKETATVC